MRAPPHGQPRDRPGRVNRCASRGVETVGEGRGVFLARARVGAAVGQLPTRLRMISDGEPSATTRTGSSHDGQRAHRLRAIDRQLAAEPHGHTDPVLRRTPDRKVVRLSRTAPMPVQRALDGPGPLPVAAMSSTEPTVHVE